MSELWGKILLACVIGAIAGGAMGAVCASYGLPLWIGGALAGVVTPLVFFFLRGRANT